MHTEPQPLSKDEIAARLDADLEAEFTFVQTDQLAAGLAGLSHSEQAFVLDWVQRVASTHVELAHQFTRQVSAQLQRLDRETIAEWALHAMDTYDRQGLRPALLVIADAEAFVRLSRERKVGALFSDIQGVLANFVHGLSGRPLKLAQGEAAYTDSETLYLPPVVAQMATPEENFRLAKALVAMLWAQTRFGTFRRPLAARLAAYADPERARRRLALLETYRLEARLGRELPGLQREMRQLRQARGEPFLPPAWADAAASLAAPDAGIDLSLELLAGLYAEQSEPEPPCYQGELHPEAVATCMAARIEREKRLLRVHLAELAEEQARKRQAGEESSGRFELRTPPEASEEEAGERLELWLDQAPVAPPEPVRELLTSIQLDLGEIPDEYLVPAGPGEYDPALFAQPEADPDAVWQGTYHEEGAFLYPEWDCGRQHYRKNWTAVREKAVHPEYDGFVEATLAKYHGLLAGLRRTFEAMRDEDRLLKRQAEGEGVDIDALVEALADARDGREMSERLFTRLHRSERNIAVLFMVDMSGSTRGWINDAEREALVLLCEVLQTLGDRYAIYGFSGISRKRCEIYRIKGFDEAYDGEVRARISGIRPQDYTRMGFAIRHLSRLLNEVDARTRVLITLSDGKPDDYNDYRGEYGIEDTRRALLEARRDGIHPFCITLDSAGPDYLPHMYGPAAYTVVDEVAKLPFRVSDIYRRLTSS